MKTKLTIDQQNQIISDAVNAAFPKLTNCEREYEADDRRLLRDYKFSDTCNASLTWSAALDAVDFRAACDTFLVGEVQP